MNAAYRNFERREKVEKPHISGGLMNNFLASLTFLRLSSLFVMKMIVHICVRGHRVQGDKF
jgi:hypothetical protein